MTLADYLNTDEIARDTLADRVRELEAEFAEQARLLGMSGEREAALLAKVAARDKRIAELEARLELLVEDGALQGLRLDKQAERLARSESARDALAELVREVCEYQRPGVLLWGHPVATLKDGWPERARAALEGK